MEIFEEEKEIQIEMSCADNPFFFFPLMENYQLHYIRFAFSLMPWKFAQQEQILAKYFCTIGKVINTFIGTWLSGSCPCSWQGDWN